MSTDNKDQLTDQLLRGIYRLCVNKDNCSDCPFYITKCVFEEPRPRTWFDEETIEIPPAPAEEEKAPEEEAAPAPVTEEPAAEIVPATDDDKAGTWLVSTTMGSMFTKYVYICSKCGYRKESVLSIAPMSFCPECEKKKLMSKI